MKALFLVLALVSVSAFAREGHEGPEAAPSLPSPVIAMVKTSSFFVPPNAPRLILVQVRENGAVELVKNFPSGKVEVTAVATLSPTLAKKIASDSRQVKETEIRDPQPNMPGCMDAPSTTYLSIQGRKEIVIGRHIDCKEMEKVDASDADRQLRTALEAAASLAYLTR
jgi:hypothetical protein